jgi:hypothetical protein
MSDKQQPPNDVGQVAVNLDRKKLAEVLNLPVPHDVRNRTFAQVIAEETFVQSITGRLGGQVRLDQLWEAVIDRLNL